MRARGVRIKANFLKVPASGGGPFRAWGSDPRSAGRVSAPRISASRQAPAGCSTGVLSGTSESSPTASYRTDQFLDELAPLYALPEPNRPRRAQGELASAAPLHADSGVWHAGACPKACQAQRVPSTRSRRAAWCLTSPGAPSRLRRGGCRHVRSGSCHHSCSCMPKGGYTTSPWHIRHRCDHIMAEILRLFFVMCRRRQASLEPILPIPTRRTFRPLCRAGPIRPGAD